MWQSIKSSAVTGIECRLSSQECDRLIETKAAEDERNSQLRVELEQVKKVANDQTQLAAKYRRMLDAARDAYIKEHSDGETDCVTPFDVYDSEGVCHAPD